ncbi:MAG: hypothetical protein P4M12_02835 [Gammaproteobacteria bacterium]|nr:hypothetical protein [Gammaproteobacteria bacterium]
MDDTTLNDFLKKISINIDSHLFDKLITSINVNDSTISQMRKANNIINTYMRSKINLESYDFYIEEKNLNDIFSSNQFNKFKSWTKIIFIYTLRNRLLPILLNYMKLERLGNNTLNIDEIDKAETFSELTEKLSNYMTININELITIKNSEYSHHTFTLNELTAFYPDGLFTDEEIIDSYYKHLYLSNASNPLFNDSNIFLKDKSLDIKKILSSRIKFIKLNVEFSESLWETFALNKNSDLFNYINLIKQQLDIHTKEKSQLKLIFELAKDKNYKEIISAIDDAKILVMKIDDVTDLLLALHLEIIILLNESKINNSLVDYKKSSESVMILSNNINKLTHKVTQMQFNIAKNVKKNKLINNTEIYLFFLEIDALSILYRHASELKKNIEKYNIDPNLEKIKNTLLEQIDFSYDVAKEHICGENLIAFCTLKYIEIDLSSLKERITKSIRNLFGDIKNVNDLKKMQNYSFDDTVIHFIRITRKINAIVSTGLTEFSEFNKITYLNCMRLSTEVFDLLSLCKDCINKENNYSSTLELVNQKINGSQELCTKIFNSNNINSNADLNFYFSFNTLLTIWDIYNLEADGPSVLIDYSNPYFHIFDRGSSIVVLPNIPMLHNSSLNDAIEVSKIMANIVYKRKWTIELEGNIKMGKAVFAELGRLGQKHNKYIEILHSHKFRKD